MPKRKRVEVRRGTFKFKDASKFSVMSSVQLDAVKAVADAGDESGIVVAPCGAGKTAMFTQIALNTAQQVYNQGRSTTPNILFVVFNNQNGLQIAETLSQAHTTVLPTSIKTCIGNGMPSTIKDSRDGQFVIATYHMLSAKINKDEEHASAKDTFKKNVFKTHWDLVILDECHIAAALTYREMIQSELMRTRILGFTGTFFRMDTIDTDAANFSEYAREHMELEFRFVGRVLFEVKSRELEEKRLIAKVQPIRVDVALEGNHAKAYASSKCQHPKKGYVGSFNPQKFNCVEMIVRAETCMHPSRQGIIFVRALADIEPLEQLLTNIVRIGSLSGSDAYGMNEDHSSRAHARTVERFNAGELDVLIVTSVGYTALDVPKAQYGIVFDGDSGLAGTGQRIGRLTRTSRSNQKEANLYELVTDGTNEVKFANRRARWYEHEEYEVRRLSYAALRMQWDESTKDAPIELEYDRAQAQHALLILALKYDDKRHADAQGRALAMKYKEAWYVRLKEAQKQLSSESTRTPKDPVKVECRRRWVNVVKSEEAKVDAEADRLHRDYVNNAPRFEVVREILADIGLSPDA